jgi:hypothetical protein
LTEAATVASSTSLLEPGLVDAADQQATQRGPDEHQRGQGGVEEQRLRPHEPEARAEGTCATNTTPTSIPTPTEGSSRSSDGHDACRR